MIYKESFRKKRNYYTALATELAAPVLRAWSQRFFPKPKMASEWKKVLIMGDAHIGDILYRTHGFPVLAASFPNTQFYYLTEPGTAEVLQNNPYCTALPLRDAGTHTVSPSSVSVLQGMGFDAVFLTNAVHYTRDLMVALKLPVGTRVGYVFKGFSGLITHPVEISYPESFPAYFRSFVAQVTKSAPTWELRPQMFPARDQVTRADALWTTLGTGKVPTIATFVTSRQKRGVWPMERFAETLLELKKLTSYRLLLCGSKGDLSLLTEMDKRFGLGGIIIAGELSLLELNALLRRTSLVFTTDSGPRHIGNAANVPVAFVRNFWANEKETGGYCSSEFDLCDNLKSEKAVRGTFSSESLTPEIAAQTIFQILNRTF